MRKMPVNVELQRPKTVLHSTLYPVPLVMEQNCWVWAEQQSHCAWHRTRDVWGGGPFTGAGAGPPSHVRLCFCVWRWTWSQWEGSGSGKRMGGAVEQELTGTQEDGMSCTVINRYLQLTCTTGEPSTSGLQWVWRKREYMVLKLMCMWGRIGRS